MGTKFSTHNPICSKHMTFKCIFLGPQLNTFYSNMGVHLRQATKLGLFILVLCTNLQRVTLNLSKFIIMSHPLNVNM